MLGMALAGRLMASRRKARGLSPAASEVCLAGRNITRPRRYRRSLRAGCAISRIRPRGLALAHRRAFEETSSKGVEEVFEGYWRTKDLHAERSARSVQGKQQEQDEDQGTGSCEVAAAYLVVHSRRVCTYTDQSNRDGDKVLVIKHRRAVNDGDIVQRPQSAGCP